MKWWAAAVIVLGYTAIQRPQSVEGWAVFLFIGAFNVLFWVGVWMTVTRSIRALTRGLKGEPIRGGR